MTSNTKMKNIAIIPARSGSKGLKNKNIKPLNGKPLIAYSIEAAIKSKCFDTIFVSTDSKKYARIAKQYGAEVPFLRSVNNAQDKSTSWDVVKETLSEYKKLGKNFDSFMILQPTSPLRTGKDIKNAFMLLNDKKANSIVSVKEADNNIESMYSLEKSTLLSNQVKMSNILKRRQDSKKYYVFNGAIYLSKTKPFEKYGNIYKEKCYAYVMDRKKSVDIDDEIDFIFAEALMK